MSKTADGGIDEQQRRHNHTLQEVMFNVYAIGDLVKQLDHSVGRAIGSYKEGVCNEANIDHAEMARVMLIEDALTAIIAAHDRHPYQQSSLRFRFLRQFAF